MFASQFQNGGDLGFVPGKLRVTSARGLLPRRPREMSQVVPSNEAKSQHVEPEMGGPSMITKRTEYLEGQERKLTATMSDLRSTTNQLEEQVKTLGSRGVDTQGLYDEMQVVYGKVKGSLNVGDEVLGDDEWVQLLYPMRQDGNRREMRCKVVDKVTGQLSLHWVTVYDCDEESETRFISEFALYPKV